MSCKSTVSESDVFRSRAVDAGPCHCRRCYPGGRTSGRSHSKRAMGSKLPCFDAAARPGVLFLCTVHAVHRRLVAKEAFPPRQWGTTRTLRGREGSVRTLRDLARFGARRLRGAILRIVQDPLSLKDPRYSMYQDPPGHTVWRP